MEIIALQDYTDKYLSLYQGQIRNIGNNLANKLITKGIVAEHDTINTENSSSGGSSSGDSSSGGGVLYGNVTLQETGGGSEGRSIKSETKWGEGETNEEVYEVDLSFSQIYSAIEDGKMVAFKYSYTYVDEDDGHIEDTTTVEYVCSMVYMENSDGSYPEYRITTTSLGGGMTYYSTSASEHMTTQEPEEPDDGGEHPIN